MEAVVHLRVVPLLEVVAHLMTVRLQVEELQLVAVILLGVVRQMATQARLLQQVPQDMLELLREVPQPAIPLILLKCHQVEIQVMPVQPQEVRPVAHPAVHREVVRQVHKVVLLPANKANRLLFQRQWARWLWREMRFRRKQARKVVCLPR
jgi:hypothetical protein